MEIEKNSCSKRLYKEISTEEHGRNKIFKRCEEPLTFRSDEHIKERGNDFFSVLTAQQLERCVLNVFKEYTNQGYKKINQLERRKAGKFARHSNLSLPKSVEVVSNVLSNELKKHSIKKELFLYRGISKEVLQMMVKSANGGICDEGWESNLSGRVIRDRGFVSTCVLEKDIFPREYLLKIKVPVGTKGAFIRDISMFKKESELLLDRDVQMIIDKVEQNPDNQKFLKIVYCTLILKEKEGNSLSPGYTMEEIKDAVKNMK